MGKTRTRDYLNARKNEVCHSVICPTHGPLVDLKRHCHNIARFFIFGNLYDENPISSWFQLASGITEVKYASDLYDKYSIWCGPAIEYETAKSSLHSKLIQELTRFNFIWGGFEALVDSFGLPDCPKNRGKINRVNSFLREKYENSYPLLQYYSELVEYLRNTLSKNNWTGDIESLFSETNCVGKKVNGLKAVYEIRNSFAHGAFRFNEPDDWNSRKTYDIQIILASSRIVLNSIQMLLLAASEDLDFNVAELHDPSEEGIPAPIFLFEMHLKESKWS